MRLPSRVFVKREAGYWAGFLLALVLAVSIASLIPIPDGCCGIKGEIVAVAGFSAIVIICAAAGSIDSSSKWWREVLVGIYSARRPAVFLYITIVSLTWMSFLS